MRTVTLSFLEARVLGCLVEKAATTPDSYPLSLNALVTACNQKTSRHPVISAADAEVQVAVDGLMRHTLVIASSGGRVPRYEHNASRGLQLDQQALGVLVVLVLRGPQTAAEIRMNVERIVRLPDIAAVEAQLEALAARPGQPLTRKLPRAPGERESRYVHLLCGEPDIEALTAARPSGDVTAGNDLVGTSEIAVLKSHVAELAAEVAALRGAVAALQADLGVK